MNYHVIIDGRDYKFYPGDTEPPTDYAKVNNQFGLDGAGSFSITIDHEGQPVTLHIYPSNVGHYATYTT